MNSSLFQTGSYKRNGTIEKIKFLDSLESISIQNKNDSIYRKFLFDLSDEYYYNNENEKSYSISQKVLILSIIAKDTLSMAKAYSYIGDYHQISHKDSAYYYYQKAEKINRLLNRNYQIGKMLFKKAYILFLEGNFIESEAQIANALLYLKKENDVEMLFAGYSLLGTNLEKLEEYNEALKYQLLAKNIILKLNNSNSNLEQKYLYNIQSTINISNIYEKTSQYDKVIKELELILTPDLKEKWPQGYVTVLGNLGYSKIKKGIIKDTDNYFNEALNLSKKNNYENNKVYQLKNLGEYYAIAKDTTASIKYLNQSLQLAQKLKMGDEIKMTLELLSQVDYKNATTYDKKYIAISDSLTKAQRINRNKYARIEYETSVIEDENKLLSTKNTYILIGSIVLMLILLSIIIIRYIKSQKREIEFRKSQQKAEEEIFDLLKEYQLKLSIAKELEQNRISKELHDSVMNKLYGARMQLGILNEYNDEEIKEKRLVYVDLLQEIEQEIRTISHDLHTEINETQFDYTNLLSNLIHLQNEIGTTSFTLHVAPEITWDSIDSLIKVTIFRIVQESLLNISKHANASTCHVSILLDGDLVLEIKDDGIGFDLKATKQGIGLQNIQERANTISAILEIISKPNKGTTIRMKAKIGSL
ncbi:MAG: sensor histidine kinase [Flavobacterium sp.]|uniref:sensor histidine kinase n=1 Tax=Flavobacterium sp. TaxID=239 RepID=UPI003BC7E0EE